MSQHRYRETPVFQNAPRLGLPANLSPDPIAGGNIRLQQVQAWLVSRLGATSELNRVKILSNSSAQCVAGLSLRYHSFVCRSAILLYLHRLALTMALITSSCTPQITR